MHGIDKEIAGLKTTLDLLIEKKSHLDAALVKAYDVSMKFSLQKEAKNLEGEINSIRDRLATLEQQKHTASYPSPQPDPMSTPQNKDELLALIREGDLKEALAHLAVLVPPRDRNDIVLQQSRLNSLERNVRQDLISSSDARIERARIVAAALDFCDLVEATAFAALNKKTILSTTSHASSISNGKRLFFSYSQYDRAYLDQLIRHLAGLRRQGKIAPWNDHDILPGEEWDNAIKNELAEADIILLLVSSDFLATDYVWKVEIETAMARHERGEARVIPVFIRACDWSGLSFSKLNGLPSKAKPVSSYADKDEAWVEVVKGIERVL